MNFRVVQMIGGVLVALAVPLALVALGVARYSSKRPAAAPAAEAPGLRAALESAADKNWRTPDALQGDRNVFVFSMPGSVRDAKKAAERSAKALEGVVVPVSAGPRGEERLLVRIPSTNGPLFESAALNDFKPQQRGPTRGGHRLYELIFPQP